MKLWKDYYRVPKPNCFDCLNQGIKPEEYAFCSTELAPQPVYWEDPWGRNRKLIHIYKEIYKCNVYHWTIYQNQGKINNHERN